MKSQTIGALAVAAALGATGVAAAQGTESAPGTSKASGDYYGGYYGGYNGGSGGGKGGVTGGGASSSLPCPRVEGLSYANAFRKNGKVKLTFKRQLRNKIIIDIFKVSSGRRIGGSQVVAHFGERSSGVMWSGKPNREGRSVTDGTYFVRYTMRNAQGGLVDTLRVALTRKNGKFVKAPSFYLRSACQAIHSFKLSRPVFGGQRARPLGISFQILRPGRVTVQVYKGRTLVGTLLRNQLVQTTATQRLNFLPDGQSRGVYQVKLTYTGSTGQPVSQTLASALL